MTPGTSDRGLSQSSAGPATVERLGENEKCSQNNHGSN